MLSTFYFRTAPGDHIETEVTLQPDPRAALYGRVVTADQKPIPAALCMLFEIGASEEEMTLFASQYTDENGHFFFGPLEAGRLFLVKVYKNSVKLRQLEIIAE